MYICKHLSIRFWKQEDASSQFSLPPLLSPMSRPKGEGKLAGIGSSRNTKQERKELKLEQIEQHQVN